MARIQCQAMRLAVQISKSAEPIQTPLQQTMDMLRARPTVLKAVRSRTDPVPQQQAASGTAPSGASLSGGTATAPAGSASANNPNAAPPATGAQPPSNAAQPAAATQAAAVVQPQQAAEVMQPANPAPSLDAGTAQAGAMKSGDAFDESIPPGAVLANPSAAMPDASGAQYAGPAATQDPSVQVYESEQLGSSVKITSHSQPPPPPPVMTPPPPPSPAVAQPAAAPASDSPLAGATIEEQLTAIEMKVFGKKQKNLPILKRLEKLETGTSGAVGEGTVQERVARLLHSYGL